MKLITFFILIFCFGFSLWAEVTTISDLGNLTEKEKEHLKVLFTPLRGLDQGKGVIPEYLSKKGVILFSTCDLYLFNHLLSLHSAIIEHTEKDEQVIVFTCNPSAYQNEEWRDKNLTIVQLSNDSFWGRDYFPEIVVGKKQIHWQGFKYDSFLDDIHLFIKKIADILGTPINVNKNFFFEGGNILVDDESTLYTTKRVFSSNYKISEEKITTILKESLGLKEVVYFDPIPSDSTGHIDLMAKIIAQHKVIVADSDTPWMKKVLDDVANYFLEKKFEVIRIKGVTVPTRRFLSYINSFVLNNTVFMPTYYSLEKGDDESVKRSDEEAIRVYEQLGYRVVPISARIFGQYGGAIHCLTRPLY